MKYLKTYKLYESKSSKLLTVKKICKERLIYLIDDGLDIIFEREGKYLFLSFDNDEKGVRASKEITEKTGWSYINPPKDLLQYNVSDWFDMTKYYKTPEAVQDYFKSKGLL